MAKGLTPHEVNAENKLVCTMPYEKEVKTTKWFWRRKFSQIPVTPLPFIVNPSPLIVNRSPLSQSLLTWQRLPKKLPCFITRRANPVRLKSCPRSLTALRQTFRSPTLPVWLSLAWRFSRIPRTHINIPTRATSLP